MTAMPAEYTGSIVAAIGTSLLTQVSDALALTAAGRPNRVVSVAGAEVPWDECDCGMLAFSVNNRYIALQFPVPAIDQLQNCDTQYVVIDAALTIVRCVARPSDNGVSPKPAAMNADFAVAESDAFTLWNTANCALSAMRDSSPRVIADVIVNQCVPLGAQGGCAGSQLQFKMGLWRPCPCG